MTTAIGLKRVEDLLRRLIEEGAAVRAERPESPCGPDGEEILFDVEVDGSRYLLVRLIKADDQTARLSPREQEIVRLVALGHSNKIIGDVLSISSWTVCTHLRRIFAKLGVGSRAAMVARLSSRGAAQPPSTKKIWTKSDALDLLDPEPVAPGIADQ
ncbi:MAG TPA: helix-turn-helix transcriptional regulator [Bryobacteraceae bacterium]|jgi:DNA-binding CsgD family transcriptional regulator